MRQCKTCENFERGYWDKSINGCRDPQMGGHCEVLLQTMKMDGNIHYTKDKVYIQDTFGCVFHKEIK